MTSDNRFLNVINSLSSAGAFSTASRHYDAPPSEVLLEMLKHGLLKKSHTIYGTVISLSDNGRRAAKEMLKLSSVDYLDGPSALADRAYQVDVRLELQSRGYTFIRGIFKKAGKFGKASRTHFQYTDQLTSFYVRIPQEDIKRRQHIWGPPQEYQRPDPGGSAWVPPTIYHPCVYASIAHGGINLPRVKALYRKHQNEIHHWRAPLLIAVPDPEPLRAYLRQLHHQHQMKSLPFIQRNGGTSADLYPLIELIVMPLPQRPATTRASAYDNGDDQNKGRAPTRHQ